MRVVAAAFSQRTAAEAARANIAATLHVDPAAIGIGSLARPDEPDGDPTVLAAHFHEDLVDTFCSVVAAHGGTVVVNVDERGTRPWRPQRRGPHPEDPTDSADLERS